MPLSFPWKQFSDEALLDRTTEIIGRVDGHYLFPDPDPAPALIGQQAAALQERTSNGGEEHHGKERKELVRLLRRLGLYIIRPVDEDKPVFFVAGLDSLRVPLVEVPDALLFGFSIQPGEAAGTMVLSCLPAQGLRAYLYEYTADAEVTPQTRWTTAATTLHALTLKDLIPGRAYHFRMAVIGRGPDHPFCSSLIGHVA